MGIFKIVLILLIISANSYAGTVINAKNRKNHPEILKIRKVCNEVMALKNTTADSKGCDEEELVDQGLLRFSATMRMDSKGVVRKYIMEGGGDSMFKTEYYYDGKGVLRFIFCQFRSPGDVDVEDRIYFNEKGDEIFANHQVKGNGWLLEPEYIFNPKDHFKKLCEKKENS